LAEPAAVVVLGIMLRAFYLDKVIIDCLLAAVSPKTITKVSSRFGKQCLATLRQSIL
jgi:hypothetical protein